MAHQRIPADWSDDYALNRVMERVDPKSFHPERQAWEEQCLKDYAYFVGKQNFHQDGVRLRATQPGSDHSVQYRANMILPAVNRAVDKVISSSASFKVYPENDTRQRRKAARVSTRIAAHQLEVTDYATEKELAVVDAAICGSGFLQTWWNPDIGDTIREYYDDENHSNVITGLGEEEMRRAEAEGRYKDQLLGEVDVETVNPFNAFWDWNNRTPKMDELEWFATTGSVSIEALVQRFGDTAWDVEEETDLVGTAWYEEALTFLSSGVQGLGTQNTRRSTRLPRARLTQYWEKPKRTNNWSGRYVALVGGRALVNGPSPYAALARDGMHYPFVKVDWWPFRGRFIQLGMVEQLTATQFQYNKARATIIEHQNVHGHPFMLVPESWGLPTGRFTIAPGSVHSYKPTGLGSLIFGEPPSLPKEVAENAGSCAREMDVISSNHSPDDALPGQLRSGAAIQAMFAEKNRNLSKPARGSIRVDREVGRNLLLLGKQNYSGSRVMKYVGPNEETMVQYFRRADICTDLRITGEPSIMESEQLRRAEIIDLLQFQVIDLNDPHQRREVLKSYRFGGSDSMIDETLLDEQAAERAIDEIVNDPLKWALAGGYPVRPFQDHEVFAAVLSSFMKTAEYENLDRISQDVVLGLWNEHVRVLGDMMKKAQELAQGMQGTPGETGTPSAPARQGAM